MERLPALEVRATDERRLKGRIRFASLPAPWRLEDFDFDAQPSLDRQLVRDLATLRFVEEAANVLLVGPPEIATYCVSLWSAFGKKSISAVGQSNPEALALP